jgi:hypothetical protein
MLSSAFSSMSAKTFFFVAPFDLVAFGLAAALGALDEVLVAAFLVYRAGVSNIVNKQDATYLLDGRRIVIRLGAGDIQVEILSLTRGAHGASNCNTNGGSAGASNTHVRLHDQKRGRKNYPKLEINNNIISTELGCFFGAGNISCTQKMAL